MATVLEKCEMEAERAKKLAIAKERYAAIGYEVCEACLGAGGKQRSKAFIECEKCHGDGGFKIEVGDAVGD